MSINQDGTAGGDAPRQFVRGGGKGKKGKLSIAQRSREWGDGPTNDSNIPMLTTEAHESRQGIWPVTEIERSRAHQERRRMYVDYGARNFRNSESTDEDQELRGESRAPTRFINHKKWKGACRRRRHIKHDNPSRRYVQRWVMSAGYKRRTHWHIKKDIVTASMSDQWPYGPERADVRLAPWIEDLIRMGRHRGPFPEERPQYWHLPNGHEILCTPDRFFAVLRRPDSWLPRFYPEQLRMNVRKEIRREWRHASDNVVWEETFYRELVTESETESDLVSEMSDDTDDENDDPNNPAAPEEPSCKKQKTMRREDPDDQDDMSGPGPSQVPAPLVARTGTVMSVR